MPFFARLLSSFFFVGYFPKFPGTIGSLAALPVIWFCPNNGIYLLLMFFFFFGGVWASGLLSRQTGLKDPQFVVVDEVAGMMLSLVAIPIDVTTLVLGFFLFRLFDIKKPFLIRKLEPIPNGWGIMLDDILAGVYANLTLRGILELWQWFGK